MSIERLHVHGPIPSRAHDLRQPLRVVLVGFVHLHLERSAGVPRIEADDVEPAAAQLVHKPRRHRAGLDADPGLFSRVPLHRPLDLPGVRGTLAPPQPATGLIDHADRRQLLRNVQTNEAGH